MVGVWFGRPDAGTMRQVAGAGSAAKLAQDVLLGLHGARPGDLLDASFPVPRAYKPVELCIPAGGPAPAFCRQRLVEWVKADAAAPALIPAVAQPQAGGPSIGSAEPPRLSITMPEQNARIWRNPEMPPALDRLALKASAPGVSQIVWYVDGLPFRTARADETVYWPLSSGAHRFQIRLPLQDGESRPVRIVVE
jgi:penicillin-binding protein 1C